MNEKTFDIENILNKAIQAVTPLLQTQARMHKEACVIAALCDGELSEVEAAKILNVDVIELRFIKFNVMERIIPDYSLTHKLK